MNKRDEIANDLNRHCCCLAEQFCGEMSCNTCITDYLCNAGYRKQSEVAREIIQIAKNGVEKYIEDITLNEGIRNMLSIMLEDFVEELKKKYEVQEE